MKRRIIALGFVILAVTFALTACGSAEVEPGVEETNEMTEEPVAPVTKETPASEEAGETTEGEPVVPVTVDMDNLQQIPPSDGTPQEMPAPGVPNPKALMVSKVKADLAQRLDLDASQIKEVNAETVQWHDASLDCAAPDHAYAQVITPGFVITLEAEGERYTYHTDFSSTYTLCGDDGRPVENLER